MKRVRVEDVIIGSIITEPVEKDGVLLCAEGLVVSRSVQKMLLAFGIDEIVVDTVYSGRIDNIITDFNKLNELARISLQHLDIDEIVMCAKGLVSTLIKSDENSLLSSLIQYDEGTFHHSKNVAILSLICGIKYGLSKNELYMLTMGALLHDVGKMLIPLSILNKQEKLTDEEYSLMKQHPLLGVELLKTSFNVSAVKQIVYQHHENWDGSGYPRQLYELNSYRLARIVHIADVYDALCARRAYKDNIPRSKTREFMKSQSGKMFDPYILKVFLKAVPAYFVGEEIRCGSKVATVIECDKDDPIVYYNSLMKLTEFEKMCGEYSSPATLKLIK